MNAEQSSLSTFPAGEIDTTETADLISARLYGVCRTIRDVHEFA